MTISSRKRGRFAPLLHGCGSERLQGFARDEVANELFAHELVASRATATGSGKTVMHISHLPIDLLVNQGSRG